MASRTQLALDSVVAPSEVAWVVADDEVVMRDASTGTTYALDPVASVLWRCLDSVSSLDEIFVDLADAFAVDCDVIVTDCLPVVASWLGAGIARLVEPGTIGPGGEATLRARGEGRTWRRLVDPPNT